MAYKMYIAGVLMPVTPSKVQLKIKNQNKTLNLINGEEINILKSAGLTEISFDLLLPQVTYPFANSNLGAAYYLSLFERLKTGKQPFQWILNRQKPNGSKLFYTNMTVSLEDYQITEDAGEGFDVKVKVNLKQYRQFGTKTVKIVSKPANKTKAVVKKAPRPKTSAPKVKTYTVKNGDCLWNIAKKYLGDGSRYTEIYKLNKKKIKNTNLIYTGQVLILPS